MSRCNVDLLINACQASYRLESNGFYLEKPPQKSIKGTPFVETIKQQGYEQVIGVKPKTEGEEGQTRLAAICLQPKFPSEPIVIAYRGTKTFDDVKSDFSIIKNGIAEMQQLDAAYKFYLNVRKKYPNHPIVLTGHSLGGHIAQYVGLQAHEMGELPAKDIAVRTFNTAPSASRLAKKFANDPRVVAKFNNYRSSTDLISAVPYYHYFGNTYSFKARQSSKIDTHQLWALHDNLPQDVKETDVSLLTKDLLLENIRGSLHAYEVYVNNQLFSSFRQGHKNLSVFKHLSDQLVRHIAAKDFDKASELIDIYRSQLSGEKSIARLNLIQNQIKTYQSENYQEMNAMNSPRP